MVTEQLSPRKSVSGFGCCCGRGLSRMVKPVCMWVAIVEVTLRAKHCCAHLAGVKILSVVEKVVAVEALDKRP